ncbi:YgdI/YgdR family lipoprotein [Winslowiella iniecta]|uniref:Lipoprotein n=1 Tax=Winslowiella iniecta TaxID=1560201 RepID=A0A0L7T932_9GAMM|nr:YgdI/YgdR family lipoprotein [Winslowiella iniecta]KOC91879.1 lipoprotein [Winslowiella iniecta]KOC94995.1 lipoprotein [Winslowiella iniecta]
MKKTILTASAIAIGLFLSGCANDHIMHTNDGRTIVADGKPQVDSDTGMITYKDAQGKEQQINRSEVKEMSEFDD